MQEFIAKYKLAFILTIIGCGLWIYTGNAYFVPLAAIVFIVGFIFRAMPRLVIWGAVAGYGAIAVPNGWFLVIVLIALLTCFPALRRFTPIGDLRKPKVK